MEQQRNRQGISDGSTTIYGPLRPAKFKILPTGAIEETSPELSREGLPSGFEEQNMLDQYRNISRFLESKQIDRNRCTHYSAPFDATINTFAIPDIPKLRWKRMYLNNLNDDGSDIEEIRNVNHDDEQHKEIVLSSNLEINNCDCCSKFQGQYFSSDVTLVSNENFEIVHGIGSVPDDFGPNEIEKETISKMMFDSMVARESGIVPESLYEIEEFFLPGFKDSK